MIFIKTADEIELMRQSNMLVSKTLAEVGKYVKPGVTTGKLDQIRQSAWMNQGIRVKLQQVAPCALA